MSQHIRLEDVPSMNVTCYSVPASLAHSLKRGPMNTRSAAAGAAALAVAILTGPPLLHAQQRDARGTPAAVDCSKVNSPTTDHVTMDHTAHLDAMKDCDTGLPTLPGQSAFGAIGEVVRMLKADPRTDWARVNVEALRQHLIDMDDVTMHAVVAQRSVPSGLEMDVTGTGRAADAIKRMAINHAKMLDQSGEYHVTAQAITNGARIVVTARQASDARTVAQIRGLGFAGLMTEGDHHAAHHLALARGNSEPHGR
jgi:hypothetical protein